MSQQNARVIIELYGLPGVGKSTLARTLAKERGIAHITATSVSRLEYIQLFFCYPRTVLVWVPLILQNYLLVKSIRHFRYHISLLFISLKKIHLAQKSLNRVTIIDEGLVQRFLSYSEVVLTEEKVRRIVAKSPLGTRLILLNDRVVTKDRYDTAHDRGSLGLERLENWRRNMTINIETIKTVLGKRSHLLQFETKKSSIDDILQDIK